MTSAADKVDNMTTWGLDILVEPWHTTSLLNSILLPMFLNMWELSSTFGYISNLPILTRKLLT